MAPKLELYTPIEVAKLFDVTAETVRRWGREGKLGAVKLPGGRVKFRRADVDQLLAELAGESVSA